MRGGVAAAFLRRMVKIGALLALPFLLQANVGGDSAFDTRVLASHNRERSSAGIAPLAWDSSLQRSAARWGARLAHSGRFEHSGGDEGENLWAGTSGRYTPEEMTGAWIAEKRLFKPGTFPANSRTGRFEDVGHYTQLMWRDSTRVGCALAKGARFDYLVCHYSSPGNVMGERPF